jgi:hypothetical protein
VTGTFPPFHSGKSRSNRQLQPQQQFTPKGTRSLNELP